MKKPNFLIPILVFLLYAALVWGGAVLFTAGANRLLAGVVLTVCGLAVLVVYWLVSKLSSGVVLPQAPTMPTAAAGLGALSGDDPDSAEVAALIREANTRLEHSKVLAGQRVKSDLTDFPLYFITGSEGSGKTSVFLGSGREPELLSGQVYRDSQGSEVAPTRFGNIWYTAGSIVMEAAGGFFSGDPGRWSRLIAAFRRGRSQSFLPRLFGGGRSARRLGGVVLCCDASAFVGVPDPSRLSAMARVAQQRLRAVAAEFAGDFPVYVIFTKADNIPYFDEYFGRLPESEDQQILGCTRNLAGGTARSSGSAVYGEAETAQLNSALNKLYYSLADERLSVLERETDRTRKPAIYEFPRELKKIRGPMVQFLVDIFRPDPLQFNPVLEGFYFTGTRMVSAGEASSVPSGAPLDRSVLFKIGDVTRILRTDDLSQLNGPSEVSRWAFTADLWQQILQPGAAAGGPAFINRRDQFYRKLVFMGVSVVSIALLLLFLNSFRLNYGWVHEIRAAAAETEMLAPGSPRPSAVQLDHIETLRTKLEDHGGFFWDFRMNQQGILRPAESFYYARFREYFLNGIVARLSSELGGLPAAQAPSFSYATIYDDLKAYRMITHSQAEASCPADDGLSNKLLALWPAGPAGVDPESERIARGSFQFYVQGLKGQQLRTELQLASDDLAVRRARDYLGTFQGIEPQYQRIITEANQQGAPARLYDVTHNYEYRNVLQVPDEVPAAFTRAGWDRVQQLIEKAGSTNGSDSCVLGGTAGRAGAAPAGDSVKAQLRQMYVQEYIRHWSDFLARASFRPYAGCPDALKKLAYLKEGSSPILAVLVLTEENTSFPPSSAAPPTGEKKTGGGALSEDSITDAFQPAAAVFEKKPNPARWADSRNGPYLNAIGNLQRDVDLLGHGGECDATDQTDIVKVTGDLGQTLAAVDQLTLNFNIGGASDSVKNLLRAPLAFKIPSTGETAKSKINGAQGQLCQALKALSGKYPFNPSSDADAAVDEVKKVFSGPESALGKVQGVVADMVVKSPGGYMPKPDAPVKFTREFLVFLSRMTDISDALFAKPGVPEMHYKLGAQTSPAINRVTGHIHDKAFDMAGTECNWPPANPEIDLRVEPKGGGDSPLRIWSGVWAIFRLLSEADHKTGTNQFSFTYVRGDRSQRQAILPDKTPIVLEVLQYPNGIREAFDPKFFQVSCPAKAVE